MIIFKTIYLAICIIASIILYMSIKTKYAKLSYQLILVGFIGILWSVWYNFLIN